MAKLFPLDLGETSSSRNNYISAEGLLHRADGFYPRPSKGLALRKATEYKNHFVDTSLYCGGEQSTIRGISMQVFFSVDTYSIKIFDDTKYNTLIKTITFAGSPPRLPLKGGNITIFELSRNSATAMGHNPFKGPSIIFIAGIGVNLKYIDDDLVLKDFLIQTSGGTKNTPICEDITSGQGRLVLCLRRSVNTYKEVDGYQVDTSTLADMVISFSAAGTFDNFVLSQTGIISAFESIITELGPSEEIYNITSVKKQVILTTSEGLWIIRSIAEETKPISYDNQFPYKVDSVPAIPCKAVQFDNNFILYAATNGIIRIRQYNSLVDLSFPTSDPGGVNMPTIHEEFRGIKKIIAIGNPYILLVLDLNGDIYSLGTSVLIKTATILFPRTSFLIGRKAVDIGGPYFWLLVREDFSYTAYRSNEKHRMHQGLQYDIFPELTVLTQNGQDITINIPDLSRMLIKVDDRWVHFKYNGTNFSANVSVPSISGSTLPYVPLLTSSSYVIPIPRWKIGVSSYQVTISGAEYVISTNVFDIRFDGDFSTDVSSLFIEEIGEGSITIESDTLPGLDSHIREIGLMWSYIPYITYDPLPKEDVGNIPDPERTLYRHSFDPVFNAVKNTMTINIRFDINQKNDEFLSVARIYTM